MVAKRVALANAEKTLALCVVVQMQEKNVNEKQRQLERERKSIIDLRKTRKEKEKQLKNKIQELGKEDAFAQFLLPGRWLDAYKEQQVKDVVTLGGEVVKLDKVIESKLSKMAPSERAKLEIETREVLKVPANETVAPKLAVIPKKLEVKSETKGHEQTKVQAVKDGKLPEVTKPQDENAVQAEQKTQGNKADVIKEKLAVKTEYRTSNTDIAKPALTPEGAKEIAKKAKEAEQEKKPGRELKKGD
jgi:hypothetical protein